MDKKQPIKCWASTTGRITDSMLARSSLSTSTDKSIAAQADHWHFAVFMKTEIMYPIKTYLWLSKWTESMSYERRKAYVIQIIQGFKNRLGAFRVLNIIIFKRHLETTLEFQLIFKRYLYYSARRRTKRGEVEITKHQATKPEKHLGFFSCAQCRMKGKFKRRNGSVG